MEETEQPGLQGTAPLSISMLLDPGSPDLGKAVFGVVGGVHLFILNKEGQE